MADDNQIKTLLLYFMDYFQRRRVILQRQLITSHNALIKTMPIPRRNVSRKMLALNNDVAAQFLNENARFVRFPTHRKKCSEQFWQTLKASGNKHLFYQHFRMSKNTFELLCEKLAPQLNLNQPLTVENQLAMSLYKLSSGCTYKEVGETFGVSKSTVQKYFHATIEAIVKLRNKFVSLPAADEALAIAKTFEKSTKLSNICGVINYTHIPITPPEHESAKFLNCIGWHSLVLQVVVDPKLLFRDVCIATGSTDNIFKESFMQKHAQKFPTSCITTANHGDLPLMLIADSSYPLHSRLLKPYKESLNDEEKLFNSHIDAGLKLSQHAFELLKARWQCLLQSIELEAEYAPSIILACCILHNFLVLNNETFSYAWIHGVTASERKFRQPTRTGNTETNSDINTDSLEIRDRIKNYLKRN